MKKLADLRCCGKKGDSPLVPRGLPHFQKVYDLNTVCPIFRTVAGRVEYPVPF